MKDFVKYEHPKQTLQHVLKSLDKSPLQTRIVQETGRKSSLPTFVVAAFSGTDLLAKGVSVIFDTCDKVIKIVSLLIMPGRSCVLLD